MGVLLRFSSAVLTQSSLGHHLTQQVVEGLRWEGHRHRQVLLHLGEGDHIQPGSVPALKAIEVGQAEGLNDLTSPVGTEVEHQNAVALLHHVVAQAHRLEEFIGDPCGVALGQKLLGALVADGTRWVGVEVVGLLRSIPALVAIHGPVTAAEAGQSPDACLLKGVLNQGEGPQGALGGGVPAIGDGVDGHVLDAGRCRPVDQPAEMVDVAVNAAIGAEPQQMQGPTAVGHALRQRCQLRCVLQLVVAHGVADPHQFLTDDPPRTDGEVPHLGVAHLLIG